MRTTSVLAFALMVAGLGVLIANDAIFAARPVPIVIQAAAVVLMIAARMTFGRRSFHAAANPTEGGLVTRGPYAILRHPIYAAVLYFIWAAVVDHLSWMNAGAGVLVTAGAVTRMLIEEGMLKARYPEYREYMKRTRRVVPYVL